MKTQNKSILPTIALILLTLGLGTLGVIHHGLQKERDGLLAERATLEGKAVILKKSYSEQKAQAENALRARQAAEAKAAHANQLVAGQEGELKGLRAKVEELTAQAAKAEDAEKGRQEEVREAIAQWKAKVEELQGTNATSQAKVKEEEAKIAELNGTVASTKGALENETRQYANCREKNVTLAGLARDLAKSYHTKGVFDSLATKEPLTQLKKVELEKLIQEYLDRIDAATLPRMGATR